jgi:hypothetical protein
MDGVISAEIQMLVSLLLMTVWFVAAVIQRTGPLSLRQRKMHGCKEVLQAGLEKQSTKQYQPGRIQIIANGRGKMETIFINLRKKWIAGESTLKKIDEDESMEKITDVFSGAFDVDEEEIPEPHIFNVPYSEFKQLVFDLPDFNELPILSLAMHNLPKTLVPRFIVRCIDGDKKQRGDELYIDTQGFEYARYKSAVRRANDPATMV